MWADAWTTHERHSVIKPTCNQHERAQKIFYRYITYHKETPYHVKISKPAKKTKNKQKTTTNVYNNVDDN